MPDEVSENVLKDISRILLDLTKTIKVVSVYPDNNPIPVKLKDSFIERFTELVQDREGLTVVIREEKIFYNGNPVYEDRGSEDALARLFHDSGITEISFTAEFGHEEANLFFKTLKSFINKEQGSLDLVAALWQADITGFDYRTLEDVALREYDGEFLVRESTADEDFFIKSSHGDDPDSGKVQYSAIFLEDETEDGVMDDGEEAVENAERKMGMEAVSPADRRPLPDTALILNDAFSLADSDRNEVERLIREDEKFDTGRCTVDLLTEILSQDREFPDFSDTVSTAEKIQSELVSLGDLKSAGVLLLKLSRLWEQLDESKQQYKERIKNALVIAGGGEKLSYLSDALNANSSIAPEDLNAYLSNFGWEAISTITDLLGVLEHRAHREAVCNCLVRVGSEHVNIISKGIFDRRWFVVRNTAYILSHIGGDEALRYLKKAMEHSDARVRFQVVKGLEKNPVESHIDLLLKLMWDHDDLVRQTALAAILNYTGETVLRAIVAIVNDDRFASLSEFQQEELIMALSLHGGEYAVNYLVSLISGGGLFKSQIKEFYRKTAFKALSANSSEKAKNALLKLSRSWSKRIRQMAEEALRNRRENVFMSE